MAGKGVAERAMFASLCFRFRKTLVQTQVTQSAEVRQAAPGALAQGQPETLAGLRWTGFQLSAAGGGGGGVNRAPWLDPPPPKRGSIDGTPKIQTRLTRRR